MPCSQSLSYCINHCILGAGVRVGWGGCNMSAPAVTVVPKRRVCTRFQTVMAVYWRSARQLSGSLKITKFISVIPMYTCIRMLTSFQRTCLGHCPCPSCAHVKLRGSVPSLPGTLQASGSPLRSPVGRPCPLLFTTFVW